MIKKLQWRIISINMVLMGIVIAAVCTALCVNAYTHAVEELEHGLNQVVERDGKGKFIPESTETGDSPFPFDKSQKERFEGKPDIHENAPMEISSYVTVELDANGNILNTTEHNVTIDEDDLQAIAQIVSKNGTRSGQLSDYGLMYVTKRFDGRYTRLMLAHWDGKRFHKPFLLPQKDPEENLLLLMAYNVPEFIKAPVVVSKDELARFFQNP